MERNAQENEPYRVTVAGDEYVALPGVFSPRHFGSTHVFAPLLPVPQDGTFLEVGCGTGILSIIAARRGARRVVAVDINRSAVINTIENARLHGVQGVIDVRESDVFSAIDRRERFDAIFWNMPFIYVRDGYEYRSMLERSLFDPGYLLTDRYLREGRQFLTETGRLLVGFGDFGDVPSLLALARQYNLEARELGRGGGVEGRHVEFIMYEMIRI